LKKKAALGDHRNEFDGVPRMSELPPKYEAINASSEAVVQNSTLPAKNDRNDKGKIMKTFKE